ncbi:lipase 3-like [Belonocnema kinseyi]|uniref:lipase 3-like n=1 Tax=Belonocnema kinseyi TaxID=2817044 RepID=UPI00143D5B66|nr:lipase 3-like [Belonocnema kinseyi]
MELLVECSVNLGSYSGDASSREEKFFESVGHVEVLPASPLLRVFTKKFCEDISFTKPLCFMVISSVSGQDVAGQNTSILAGLLPYFPAGCSTKQLLHFGFGFENPNTFRQYDYGVAKNLLKYKSVTPPEYPLEKVTVPVSIYHGTNDFLVDPKDIALLENKLKNIVRVSICNASLNHFDFNYGSNIRMEAYNDALKLMEGY